jgi:hypothetical protein
MGVNNRGVESKLERRIFITCILYHILLGLCKSRRMIGAEYVARIRMMRNAYRIMVEKPEGNRLFGGVQAYIQYVDNIKINF